MNNSDSADKSFEPTPKKLEDARRKGDIAKSVDLQTAAAYAGLTIAFLVAGQEVVRNTGTELMMFLDQSASLSEVVFSSDASAPLLGGLFLAVARAVTPIFAVPAVFVLVTIFAQKAFVVAPSKLVPKLSKISVIQNAKQKFGRAGLFEFAKSFLKLLIYSTCLGVFLNAHLPNIVTILESESGVAIELIGELSLQFLFIVVVVAGAIGVVDAVFQHQEHNRKNRMSRKEVMDEMKDSEGDPHMKQERRNRAQAIATAQMISEVPRADVVIVNPTHFAVVLSWSRTPGSAPKCVGKGIDALAKRIREVANEAAVPIHSDPPTARALHASINVGEEVLPEHYQAVAAAIRFADEMRVKAKKGVFSHA